MLTQESLENMFDLLLKEHKNEINPKANKATQIFQLIHKGTSALRNDKSGVRPPIPRTSPGCGDYISLMTRCWNQLPEQRPAFQVPGNVMTQKISQLGY